MPKVNTSSREWAQQAFRDAVVPSLSSPYALQPAYASGNQIQNRASVSNDLKAVMGEERIPAANLQPLTREFGPNGEQVYELSSKDPRVRFVGTWVNFSNSNGTAVSSSVANDWVEIAFYGTALNMLVHAEGARAVRVTTDGGTEVATDLNTGYSGVLGNLNYSMNAVIRLVSGLALGWHIVKVRQNQNGTNVLIHGFEISGGNSLVVPAGSAFSGMTKDSLLLSTVSAHTNSVTGTRGGRVIKYLKDGAISESFQPVDASSAFWPSATHGNEDVVRLIGPRDFGAQHANDWSTVPASSTGIGRSFALDDGSTILHGNNLNTTSASDIYASASGSFWCITFVGTGLDVIGNAHNGATGNTANVTITVDGVSVFSGAGLPISPASRKYSLASGLPYGSHTLRLTSNATGGVGDLAIQNFLIYQPKKPSIPAGAVELADFNVLATFANNSTAGQDTIARGVLRKHSRRELTYVNGSGGSQDWTFQTSLASYVGGTQIATDRNAAYMEFMFFGTGFEFRTTNGTGDTNVTVLLDDLVLNTTNYPGISSGAYGGSISFTASTGVYNASGTSGSGFGFWVSGFPLGLHRLKLLKNNASQFLHVDAIDIVTPIHSHDKGFLKIGSLAMQDSRNLVPTALGSSQGVDLSKAKAWVLYDKPNNRILASMNISAVVNVATGDFIIYFARPFKSNNYIAVGTPNTGSVGNEFAVRDGAGPNKTADHCRVTLASSGGTATDLSGGISVVFFGELENEETQ